MVRHSFAFVVLALAGCSAPVTSRVSPPPPSELTARPVVVPGGADAEGTRPTDPSSAGPGVYDGGGAVQWSDGGWEDPFYDVAESVSVTGTDGSQSASCHPGDTVVFSGCGCAVNGGTLVSGGPTVNDQSSWTCVGRSDVPARGATIIAWVECKRGAS